MLNPKINFSIVLVAPEIPGNTGSIGRTCLALHIPLILIHPLGFDLDEKAVRRAGLDYWKHVQLTEFADWDQFKSIQKPSPQELCLFSSHATTSYFEHRFKDDNSPVEHYYLVFGGETAGLPASITDSHKDRLFKLPMFSEHVRSLNLSNAVTAVAYEGIRQNLL